MSRTALKSATLTCAFACSMSASERAPAVTANPNIERLVIIDFFIRGSKGCVQRPLFS